MKLKEFYEEYLKGRDRKRGDMLHAFYRTEEDRRRGGVHSINENEIAEAYEKGGLIMEADAIETRREEGEGSNVSFDGRGASFKFIWYVCELDADQAQLALGVHPLLRRQKAAENKPIQATGETASTKRRKTPKKRRRFTL